MGGGWIPAFAGMTAGDSIANWASGRRPHILTVIPAQAGIQNPGRCGRGRDWWCSSFLPHPTLSRWERALRLAPRIGRAMPFPIATPSSVHPTPFLLYLPPYTPYLPPFLFPTVIPAPRRHSRPPPPFPPPTVIPAIYRHSRHPPSFPQKRESTPRHYSPGVSCQLYLPGFWIPACAGMTVGGGVAMGLAGVLASAGVLDSGLRRNDGEGRRGDGVGRGVGIRRGSGFRPAPE